METVALLLHLAMILPTEIKLLSNIDQQQS